MSIHHVYVADGRKSQRMVGARKNFSNVPITVMKKVPELS